MRIGFIVTIIGAFMAAASILLLGRDNMKAYRNLVAVIIVVGMILFIGGSSFEIIPTGYTGVKTTFGQISSVSLKNGMNFKIPFVQSIDIVNNKQQDVHIEEKVWSVTAENTNVFIENVVITYKINPEKSAWIYANVTNYKDNLISNTLAQSALKSSSVQLRTDEVPNRSLLEPLAKEQMQKAIDSKYGSDVVSILAVNIGNVDFESGYNEALERKQEAQKAFETAQINNRTKVEEAEADAKAQLLKAQAEADAKIIRAKAEAEANEILTSKLTKAILMDKYIEKWDGKLPRVGGDTNNILDISSMLGEE